MVALFFARGGNCTTKQAAGRLIRSADDKGVLRCRFQAGVQAVGGSSFFEVTTQQELPACLDKGYIQQIAKGEKNTT